MPIEVKNVNGGIGVSIVGRGVVTEREYLHTLRKHLTQDPEKFKKYRYSLSDYTAVTKVEVSTEAIWSIAELCKSAAKVNPDAVVAIVVDRDYLFGLSRMMETVMDDVEWDYLIFRNKEDAETWIRQRVWQKYSIDDLIFD
jgi:aconitase A